MSKTLVKNILALFGVGISPIPRRLLFGKKALTTIQIGKYSLELNKGHDLTYYIKHYSSYNQNLPRLVSFLASSSPGLSVIDVGANVGDTVLFIKNQQNVPIICIEGDDYYYKLLKKNTAAFPDVTAIQVFLSDKNEKMKAGFDFSKGTLSVNENSGDQEIAVMTLDSIIANDPALFASVRVLKTDTDGYDMKVLRGAWNFLQRQSPVLFFEYDRVFLEKQQEKGIDLLRKLAEIGYHRVLFYDNYGRFITTATLDQMDTIESLHDYINHYKGQFEFYDLCIFHRKDEELAKQFYNKEKLLNA